jgi:hypothetical protein
MKKRFVIDYTEKTLESGQFTGFHRKEGFATHEEAQEWVTNNQDKLYWNQIIEVDASSQIPKMIVKEIVDAEWEKHEGTLETYYETGMECMGLVLYKDEPKGTPNSSFDPSKPETSSNFKNYKSFEALKFVEKGSILEIDGVKYAMLKDRAFAQADGYRLSVYPIGFSRQELVELFGPGNKKATLYLKKKDKK